MKSIWRGGLEDVDIKRRKTHERVEEDSMQDVGGSKRPQGTAATPRTNSTSTVCLSDSKASTVSLDVRGCSQQHDDAELEGSGETGGEEVCGRIWQVGSPSQRRPESKRSSARTTTSPRRPQWYFDEKTGKQLDQCTVEEARREDVSHTKRVDLNELCPVQPQI